RLTCGISARIILSARELETQPHVFLASLLQRTRSDELDPGCFLIGGRLTSLDPQTFHFSAATCRWHENMRLIAMFSAPFPLLLNRFSRSNFSPIVLAVSVLLLPLGERLPAQITVGGSNPITITGSNNGVGVSASS